MTATIISLSRIVCPLSFVVRPLTLYEAAALFQWFRRKGRKERKGVGMGRGVSARRATTNTGLSRQSLRDHDAAALRHGLSRCATRQRITAASTLRVCRATRARMPSSRHTIMYCVKGVNQKSFSGSKAVAVRTPVRTSSCQSLFLESSAAGCPPGGRALQGGPAVLGRVAASAITVWKSAL